MLHYNVIRNNFKFIFCIIILFFGHDSVRAMELIEGALGSIIEYLHSPKLEHDESLFMLIKNNAFGNIGILLGVGGFSAVAIGGPLCLVLHKNMTNVLMVGFFTTTLIYDCFFDPKSRSLLGSDPNMPTMKNFIEYGQVVAALIMATNTLFRK